MMRILKTIGLLAVVGTLSACGSAPYVSEPAVLDSGASIQTGVTGGGLRGTEETLVEVNTQAGITHLVRSNFGLGRELIASTVPGVVNTVVGGVVAHAVNHGSSCGGNGCGSTFVIQGGSAVAGSVSTAETTNTTDVTVGVNTTCTNPVNGVCPGLPNY